MHVVLRDVTDVVNEWSADDSAEVRKEKEAEIKDLASLFFRYPDGRLNEGNWEFAKPHSYPLYQLVDEKIVITLDDDNKILV